MFQMQICITFLFFPFSGPLSDGLEKVLRQAEFITDIYQQVHHGCIFIINCEAQQQVGE